MYIETANKEMTLGHVWLLSIVLAVAYTVATSIYRLYYHPLAKFPGPFWARLTDFPSWWHTRKRERHIWLWRLQQEYGPTFRYGPNSVVINTPTAFRKIFGPKSNVKKSDFYEAWPRNTKAINTWDATNIATHARKRRVLNQAFSDKALRSFEPFIQSNTYRWIELIEQEIDQEAQHAQGSEWSASLNLADWTNYLIMDILGDLCFGQSFGMKEAGGKFRQLPELIEAFLTLLQPIAHSPLRPLWIWLKPKGLDWLMEAAAPHNVKQWRLFVEKCLTERTQKERTEAEKPESEVRKDFFHYLFNAIDPETGKLGYTLDELYGESELLIIAGSDTTATVTSSVFFYLTDNLDIQVKLAKEILSTFSSLDDITSGAKLQSCKYLRAVIQESLRMNSPVPTDPSRVVLPGGMTVDGYYFPEGSRVSTAFYCLSYNPDVYPEPFQYRPERWMVNETDPTQGSSAESVALAESGLCAFSTGTRGCVGKNLAWLEMNLVIAKTIYLFELKRDPTNNLGAGHPKNQVGRRSVHQYQNYDVFTSVRYGPMVQFKKRVHDLI